MRTLRPERVVEMQFIFVVEKTDDEYLAYCDELRAIAGGQTEAEAIENLKAAVKELLKDYGHEILAPDRKRVLVEVG